MAAYDFTDFVSPLPYPGEHLREEFLPGYHLTAGALAKAMGLKDRTRIERLIRERQRVTRWPKSGRSPPPDSADPGEQAHSVPSPLNPTLGSA